MKRACQSCDGIARAMSKNNDQARNAAMINMSTSAVRNTQHHLPICMHCEQFRDDSGHWGRPGSYLETHTDVVVTHGLCPTCLEVHYPEFAAAGARGGW